MRFALIASFFFLLANVSARPHDEEDGFGVESGSRDGRLATTDSFRKTTQITPVAPAVPVSPCPLPGQYSRKGVCTACAGNVTSDFKTCVVCFVGAVWDPTIDKCV